MKVYFSGIGGIGMSALAQIAHIKGCTVLGSDIKRSYIIDKLEKLGIKVYEEQSANNIDNSIDLLVYSSSIDEYNPEMKRAKELGINIIHRSNYLQDIIKNHRVIAVTGSSGKTTTSSLVSYGFNKLGIKVNGIIGGWVREWDSNVIYFNDSDISVIEADESDGSLINYKPIISIINDLSIDLNINSPKFRSIPIDKLKYAIYDIFFEYVKNIVSNNGRIIFSLDDSVIDFMNYFNLRKYLDKISFYGSYEDFISKKEFLDNLNYDLLYYKDIDIKVDNGNPFISSNLFYYSNKSDNNFLGRLDLSTIGKYNLNNASSAVLTFIVYNQIHKIFDNNNEFFNDYVLKFISSFYNFRGPKRRFEILYNNLDNNNNRLVIVDDYAHNPKKIYSLVSNLSLFYRDYYKVVIYQPHRYTRTLIFWEDLKHIFKDIDLLIILPIYSAGESSILGISSENLVKEILLNKDSLNISEVLYIENYEILENELLSRIRIMKDKIMVFVGAGNITNYANKFVNKLNLNVLI
ncbi:MAG: UDP-N-acetylmuramate--L-alanine ligase [bacterium]